MQNNLKLLLLALLSILTPISLLAQDNIKEVLTFTDEVSGMAIDPAGQIYIVSPAGGKITRFNPETKEKSVFGGFGSSNALFDAPTDIDPTNGLVIYVADAGRRKVLRFSSEMRLQEQLSATSSQAHANNPTNLDNETIFENNQDTFSPERISVTETGQIFAIDPNQGKLFSWGPSGEFQPDIFGLLDQGYQPTDILAGENRLYVLNENPSGILIFDHLGNYQRTLAGGHLRNIISLGWHFGQLWIIQTDKISTFDPEAGLINAFKVPNILKGARIIDAIPYGEFIFWLTSHKLIKQQIETSN